MFLFLLSIRDKIQILMFSAPCDRHYNNLKKAETTHAIIFVCDLNRCLIKYCIFIQKKKIPICHTIY